MKISHAVGKAGSYEEMIQIGNMCAGADDPVSEETKSVKMKKTPRQPSQREREEHERTHLPFRDWCTHCIKAKSRNDPHKRERDRCDERRGIHRQCDINRIVRLQLLQRQTGQDDEGGVQRGIEQGRENEQTHDCRRGPRDRSYCRPHVLTERTR